MNSFDRRGRLAVVGTIVFPVSQILFLALMLLYGIKGNATPVLWTVLIALAVLCAIVDVALIRAMLAGSRSNLVEERIHILEQQMDLQQQDYERTVQSLERARAMRDEIVDSLRETSRLLGCDETGAAMRSMEKAVELSGSTTEAYCENRVVNALAMMKFRACRSEGIEVDALFRVPDSLAIMDVDLCAVLSNMLDNAISACRRADGDRRRITVRMGLEAGVMLIDVVNGTTPPGERKPELAPKRPASLSVDRKHGWGLQILEVLAGQYHGTVESGRIEDGWYRTTVMLINEERGKL